VRALLSATFLLTALLCPAHQASAAPPTTTDPPDILTPTEPPAPQPCQARPVPCDSTPTRTGGTASGPGRTTSPVRPPAPTGTNRWLIAIPVLALLTLAAAGAVLLLQRPARHR
jgi:hypothetical protein